MKKNISWGKPEPEPAEWDEPLALAEFDPPPFPTDALPSWLCSFVEAVAISLQVPVDMPGTLVLTACGAAVAGKFIVRMTPDWKEPLVLQALLIMLSGEKKSATVDIVLEPIEEYERKLVDDSKSEIAKQQGQKEILEQRLRIAQSAAAKAKGADRETGADDIKNAVRDLYGWASYRIILDWFHLAKKCKERLSMGMKGRAIRNDILKQLLSLLWLGKVDAAIEYLKRLNASKVRNAKEIEKLIAYLNETGAISPVMH